MLDHSTNIQLPFWNIRQTETSFSSQFVHPSIFFRQLTNAIQINRKSRRLSLLNVRMTLIYLKPPAPIMQTWRMTTSNSFSEYLQVLFEFEDWSVAFYVQMTHYNLIKSKCFWVRYLTLKTECLCRLCFTFSHSSLPINKILESRHPTPGYLTKKALYKKHGVIPLSKS